MKKPRVGTISLGVIVGIVLLSFFVLRIGVFTVQPIGGVPEGKTIIYYGRSNNMPFFASADGICLDGDDLGVTLLCRGITLGVFVRVYENNIIIRMPYSEWAYRQSTGGLGPSSIERLSLRDY